MTIISAIQSLYYSMKNGWHTGKGSKYLKRKDYKTAIRHLSIALRCSERTENDANVAFGHEILADAYLRSKNYEKAIEHAKQSCDLYSQFLEEGPSKVFSERLRNSKKILTKTRHNKALEGTSTTGGTPHLESKAPRRTMWI